MDISTSVVALLVPAQVLKERIALTGFRDSQAPRAPVAR